MLWIVHTTGRCNLRCKYCGGSFPERLVPYKEKYSVERLARLISKDPDPTVIFYGGEPLLNARFIMEVMDSIKAHYGIQTNGTLPHLLPKNYWERMETVLISVDGVEWLTDKYRGEGIYKRAINTARWLAGFCNCRRIARMTVTKDTCIYRDVTHLLDLGVFTHVHWQLDVVWDEPWPFLEWAKNRYLPGIRRLVMYMGEKLAQGEIPGIVPFLGVLTADKKGGWHGVPCGAGRDSVSVSTDGRLLACPIAVGEKWAEVGSVDEGVKRWIDVRREFPDCASCPYFKWCGGRCLYALYERHWGEEGHRAVCWVTQRTIDHILKLREIVEKLVEMGVISWDDVLYDPLRDSTEVIP